MKLDKTKRAEVDFMVEQLKYPAKTLSAWEERFWLSIALQWGARHFITDKQYQVLSTLYSIKG